MEQNKQHTHKSSIQRFLGAPVFHRLSFFLGLLFVCWPLLGSVNYARPSVAFFYYLVLWLGLTLLLAAIQIFGTSENGPDDTKDI